MAKTVVNPWEMSVNKINPGLSNNFFKIQIDTEIAKQHCDNFCDYAGEFEGINIFQKDENSTLLASQNAKAEFDLFSSTSELMGETIKQDATNMHQKTVVIENKDAGLAGYEANFKGFSAGGGRKG